MNKMSMAPAAMPGLEVALQLVRLCGVAQTPTIEITPVHSFDFSEAGKLMREVIELDRAQECPQTIRGDSAMQPERPEQHRARGGADGSTGMHSTNCGYQAQTLVTDGVSYVTLVGLFSCSGYIPKHNRMSKTMRRNRLMVCGSNGGNHVTG